MYVIAYKFLEEGKLLISLTLTNQKLTWAITIDKIVQIVGLLIYTINNVLHLDILRADVNVKADVNVRSISVE